MPSVCSAVHESSRQKLIGHHLCPDPYPFVRVAGNLSRSDFFSALGVEHEQTRRRPSSDEEAVVSFVYRHREVILSGCDWPTGDNSATYSANDFDFLFVRDIDEQADTRFFELKRFGMCMVLQAHLKVESD